MEAEIASYSPVSQPLVPWALQQTIDCAPVLHSHAIHQLDLLAGCGYHLSLCNAGQPVDNQTKSCIKEVEHHLGNMDGNMTCRSINIPQELTYAMDKNSAEIESMIANVPRGQFVFQDRDHGPGVEVSCDFVNATAFSTASSAASHTFSPYKAPTWLPVWQGTGPNDPILA
jgi:hypothetical protein